MKISLHNLILHPQSDLLPYPIKQWNPASQNDRNHKNNKILREVLLKKNLDDL